MSALVDLLSEDPRCRKRAVAAAPPGIDTWFALRNVLLFDRQASLRAAAALRLGDARDLPDVIVFLTDALADPFPMVRHAVYRAMGRLRDAAALPVLERAALEEEPVWWARKAALVALARLGGKDAALLLGRALDDPAWRVRHAALRALAKLVPLPNMRTLGEDAAAAPAMAELWSADPAVTNLRLQQRADVPASWLLPLLGNAHGPLRQTAAALLVRSRDADALRGALDHLRSPRTPHAPALVRALLEELPHALASDLARFALGSDNAGAIVWALGWIASRRETSLYGGLSAATGHHHARVRRAAVDALLVIPPPANVVEALQRAAADHVGARVELLRYADEDALRRALRDPHPFVRASAVSALDAAGWLTADERAAAFDDRDPWLRAAALDAQNAMVALRVDPDPQVRRSALLRLPAAAAVARTSVDAWLRMQSALYLPPDTDLRALLELGVDPDLAVRAMANDRIEQARDPSARLAMLIDGGELPPAMHMVAVKHLFTHDPAAALRRIEDEDLRAVFVPRSVVATEEPAARAPRAPVHTMTPAPRRRMGANGPLVSPIGLSGGHELPARSFAYAFERGVNLFFWEPHYRSLSRFIREHRRERSSMVIATGSFHAGPDAVRADLERALRRLRTDRIDLFMLFWVRAPERLSDEVLAALAKWKEDKTIGAVGFSTHDRQLARDALSRGAWDLAMIRHSAAHPGAEVDVLPTARERGAGVLTFSALCYGRLLRKPAGADNTHAVPSAADCYRYSLSQEGVSACLSAPRRQRELEENLAVLSQPELPPDAIAAMKAHGAAIGAENRRWNVILRDAVPPARVEEEASRRTAIAGRGLRSSYS